MNLIGEHTDYNDGFVIAAWHSTCTHTLLLVRAWTADCASIPRPLAKCANLDLDSIRPGKSGIITGAITCAASRECLTPLDTNCVAQISRSLAKCPWDRASVRPAAPRGLQLHGRCRATPRSTSIEMQSRGFVSPGRASLSRETMCGIMDQFISCHGRAGHALMLDCRSLDFQLLPVPSQVRPMVCNTMVRHEHASGGYNTRRRECEEGLRALQQVLPDIRALRDVTIDELEQHRSRLTPLIYKRVRHVVTENDRVKMAASALQATEMARFGELMADSHRSLRDDYEVSTPELDLMVELAVGQNGVYGSRMTGGGFGGCTINLVDSAHAREVQQRLEQIYEAKTGLKPTILICEASDGAGAVAETWRSKRRSVTLERSL